MKAHKFIWTDCPTRLSPAKQRTLSQATQAELLRRDAPGWEPAKSIIKLCPRQARQLLTYVETCGTLWYSSASKRHNDGFVAHVISLHTFRFICIVKARLRQATEALTFYSTSRNYPFLNALDAPMLLHFFGHQDPPWVLTTWYYRCKDVDMHNYYIYVYVYIYIFELLTNIVLNLLQLEPYCKITTNGKSNQTAIAQTKNNHRKQPGSSCYKTLRTQR